PIPPEVDRVFDSLKLTPVPSSQATSQNPATPPEWQEYSYPEDGFSISAPSKPRFQKTGETSEYVLYLASDQMIVISIGTIYAPYEIPAAKEKEEEKRTALLVKAQTKKLFETLKVKLVSQKEITFAGYPGLEAEAEGAGGRRAKFRAFDVRGRLFKLLYLGPPGMPVPADVDRFFDSLKFTPGQAVQNPVAAPGWQEYSYPEDGFSISAPSRPDFKKVPQGNLENHNYTVNLDGNRVVMVSVTDTKLGNNLNATQALSAAKTAFSSGLNLKLSSEREIKLREIPGLEFAGEGPQWRARCRFYMVQGKLVQMIALGPVSLPLAPESDGIFKSLNLLSDSR